MKKVSEISNKSSIEEQKIENLLNQKNIVPNEIIKEIIKENKRRKEEEIKEQVLKTLQSIEERRNIAVEELRQARKVEAKRKKYLNRLLLLEEKFLKDANIEEYNSGLNEAYKDIYATGLCQYK